MAVSLWFGGTFDGDGQVISNLHVQGGSYVGLFGRLGSEASVSNLALEAVEVSATGDCVGSLAGYNTGVVAACHTTAIVGGTDFVGALIGWNRGSVTDCYSTGTVSGEQDIGGLVGNNIFGYLTGCYSTSVVSGSGDSVGGLVGRNESPGFKVPWPRGFVTACFWDTQTSGQATSDGGTGKTTAEMQTASTFLEAGWDFVGETANGTEDIWWILEGKGYPKLWWETHDN
jgi:hypothetical protein